MTGIGVLLRLGVILALAALVAASLTVSKPATAAPGPAGGPLAAKVCLYPLL
ncbi:MAG: hypothetical protein VX640_12185 [Pseudomonadota bacterium]|nr:hypothetical protein [Pseudomonadota bacterium]